MISQHTNLYTTELSLTVPITNSMAFLFTVLGEWWVERKVKPPPPIPLPIVTALLKNIFHFQLPNQTKTNLLTF